MINPKAIIRNPIKLSKQAFRGVEGEIETHRFYYLGKIIAGNSLVRCMEFFVADNAFKQLVNTPLIEESDKD